MCAREPQCGHSKRGAAKLRGVLHFVEAKVTELGGDPRYEIARMRVLCDHDPVEAIAIAKAVVRCADT